LHICGSTATFDRSKKTLLVVSHDASRTGAPILCLNIVKQLKTAYNIVTLLLGGEAQLREDFARESQMIAYLDGYTPAAVAYACPRLLLQIRPDIALVNSIVSYPVLPVLAQASIPIVTLVHERACMYPIDTLEGVVRYSSELVFSGSFTMNEAKSCASSWVPEARAHILPHWPSALDDGEDAAKICNVFRPDGWPDDTVVVLGIGSVNFRKGVDLFIQCAQQIVARGRKRSFLARGRKQNIRFAWIGHGYDPKNDMSYSIYLSEQIRRSSLEGQVIFAGEVIGLRTAYQMADLFLLTSRLDALPNVAIDAMCAGLPVLCFENGSGVADILAEEGLQGSCVAPYLDTAAMAELAVRLIGSPSRRRELGQKLSGIARDRFSMDRYISSLRQLLERARAPVI
jgi:glycosyltransferase involved in cell wall biosynthesis